MSDTDDIMITVSANYVKNTPDLQMRLFIRSLLNGGIYGVSDDEKIQILHNEADRYARGLPSEGSAVAAEEQL